MLACVADGKNKKNDRSNKKTHPLYPKSPLIERPEKKEKFLEKETRQLILLYVPSSRTDDQAYRVIDANDARRVTNAMRQ